MVQSENDSALARWAKSGVFTRNFQAVGERSRQRLLRRAPNDDVSCASFPPMTPQGVARRIDLFRKVVRSALIGVHSLDQVDVRRANFLFGRSRLQTENFQRSGDAHALVANGLARLPAVWLSPPPFPPSPFVGVSLPSACDLLDSVLGASSSCRRRDCCCWSARSESALYRRPSLAMTASSAGARAVFFSKGEPTRGRAPKFPRPRGP